MRIVNVMPAAAWGAIGYELLEQGCGGRETALLQLSKEWAKEGHEVLCYVPRETVEHIPFGAGTVSLAPESMAPDALRSVPFNAVVSWEEPRVFADHSILDAQAHAVRITEYQVANPPPGSLDDVPPGACFTAALSEWHGRYLAEQGINPGDIRVFPNGVDSARYPSGAAVDRGPRFVYSSSPDRGLSHLLELWSELKSEIEVHRASKLQTATLHVAYGIDHWTMYSRYSHNLDGHMAATIIEGLEQPGVVYEGRIGQGRLAQIQQSCSLCLYPCDTTQPTETGCITLVEAAAAGCPAVTTDCDCLGEEFSDVHVVVPLPFDPDAYIEATVESYGNVNHLRERSLEFAASRSWKLIAQKWIDFFSEEGA